MIRGTRGCKESSPFKTKAFVQDAIKNVQELGFLQARTSVHSAPFPLARKDAELSIAAIRNRQALSLGINFPLKRGDKSNLRREVL